MYSYRNTGYFITIIISLLVFNLQIQSQDDQNDIHVYTIGNLADLEPDMPQLEALVNKIEETKKQAVVLFSGDIIKSNLSKESLRDLDSIRLFNITADSTGCNRILCRSERLMSSFSRSETTPPRIWRRFTLRLRVFSCFSVSGP